MFYLSDRSILCYIPVRLDLRHYIPVKLPPQRPAAYYHPDTTARPLTCMFIYLVSTTRIPQPHQIYYFLITSYISIVYHAGSCHPDTTTSHHHPAPPSWTNPVLFIRFMFCYCFLVWSHNHHPATLPPSQTPPSAHSMPYSQPCQPCQDAGAAAARAADRPVCACRFHSAHVQVVGGSIFQVRRFAKLLSIFLHK